MKKLVYSSLLAIAGSALAGCGGQGGRSLGIPIDSDTIVLLPKTEQQTIIIADTIDSISIDSIGNNNDSIKSLP